MVLPSWPVAQSLIQGHAVTLRIISECSVLLLPAINPGERGRRRTSLVFEAKPKRRAFIRGERGHLGTWDRQQTVWYYKNRNATTFNHFNFVLKIL